MLYDTKGNSQNICGMANEVYKAPPKNEQKESISEEMPPSNMIYGTFELLA